MKFTKKRVLIIFLISIVLGLISIFFDGYALTLLFIIIAFICNNYINNYTNDKGGKYNE
jgi:hypothetical protein